MGGRRAGGRVLKRAAIAVLNVVGDLDFAAAQNHLQALRETHGRYAPGVLVLRINSAGGSLAAAQELCEGLAALQAEGVWVLACCGDMAQSAALYLACAADHVLAQPGSVLGSVGAIMRSSSYEGLAQRLGVRELVLSSGAAKDPAAAARDGSAQAAQAAQAALQALVDAMAEQFRLGLLAHRPLSPAAQAQLQDGRSITGAEALALGLVDELGGYWRALTLAADRLGSATPRLLWVNEALQPRRPWYVRLLPAGLQRLYQQWQGP